MTRNEIVVGLDESPSARAALHWAASQARLLQCVLRAIHVIEQPTGYGAEYHTFLAMAYTFDAEVDDAYRSRLVQVFDEVEPRPDWLLQFAKGEAGSALVHQAEQSRLLVVGTREHVGLGRLISGSVSHYCLSHASCPVVAVPATLEEELGGHDTDQTDSAPLP